MKTIKTNIIPDKPIFAKVKDQPHELNYEAICVFCAIGFFLDKDSYWKDEMVLPPASINILDKDGYLVESNPWFKWSYNPKNDSFEDVVLEFSNLFEKIILENIRDEKVILPLSGGLDSRTLAVALKKLNKNVYSYSYSFKGGFPEHIISKKIAKSCNFRFHPITIEQSSIWKHIEKLSEINKCQADFINARAINVYDELENIDGTFLLGHWGDVLFDDMHVEENINLEQQTEVVLKKILKKGGLEFANDLWTLWKLEGDFIGYLKNRIYNLLNRIDIENSANARIRAFKSMYWAPRWTSANMPVFSNFRKSALPYYDDKMCEFITKIPEEFLKERKIQIAYIKNNNPQIAKIVWQEKKPFNLYNFHLNKIPYNLPYRIKDKMKRIFMRLSNKMYIQRNYELQFLGDKNRIILESYLFKNQVSNLISKEIINKYLNFFYKMDNVKYSHVVSMLLTLALFENKYKIQ